LHPKHPKVAYAMFRIGLSYFNDLPSTVARDLTDASKAQDAFNEFLRRFPTDPNAADARKDLADCRKELAEKELYIANFYFTTTAQLAKDKLIQIEKENLHNEE
jgi:outer membrane protein assembly factor BamD